MDPKYTRWCTLREWLILKIYVQNRFFVVEIFSRQKRSAASKSPRRINMVCTLVFRLPKYRLRHPKPTCQRTDSCIIFFLNVISKIRGTHHINDVVKSESNTNMLTILVSPTSLGEIHLSWSLELWYVRLYKLIPLYTMHCNTFENF